MMRKLVIFLLYLLTSGMVFFVFIIHPGINGYSRAMFPDMIYGKAYKPFVYRTLVPTTVRIVAEITPESVKDRIKSAVQESSPQRKRIRMMKTLGWEIECIYEYAIALIIMFCFFLAFPFLLRYLVRLSYDYPPFVADFAPVGGLLILPIFFKFYSYLYDPPTLVLFTLAIILIAKRKLLLFYFVFLLATLNKETSILLLGVFFMREFKVMRNLRLAVHLILLTSLWIAVKASIIASFRNNPGSFIDLQLIDHNLGLIFASFTSFITLYHLLYVVVAVLIFWVLIHHKWTEKPIFLRHSFLITIIPLSFLVLLFGSIIELRVFYEVFPFLFLLSLPTIVDKFGPLHNDKPARELP